MEGLYGHERKRNYCQKFRPEVVTLEVAKMLADDVPLMSNV